MYQYILFDLDGTLTDPGLGITNSVMHALKKFQIHVADRRELYSFIGPPLQDSFAKYYGFTEEETEQAIQYYREYFSTKGLFENQVYNGIPALLAELKDMGKTLIVATSKPEPFSIQILKHFGLYAYFDFVAGATMDNTTRFRKADVIAYALERCRITDRSAAVMIGDREHDILGAKQTGLDSIGVTYGYGSREELQNAGATYIAETEANILQYL